MSTLDSNSTRDDVLNAYADNASYQEDNSLAKAKAFVTACRLLLSPKFSVKRSKGINGTEVELDLALIRKELDAAQSFVSSRDTATTGAAVTHLSLANFRG